MQKNIIFHKYEKNIASGYESGTQVVSVLLGWSNSDFPSWSLDSFHNWLQCSHGPVRGPLKFVPYTEDLPSVIEKHELDHHLYADDTQIVDHLQLTQAAAVITNIERCVESVHVWCTSKRLQLNPTKSVIIWFGSWTSLHRLHGVAYILVQTSSPALRRSWSRCFSGQWTLNDQPH